MWRAIRPSRLAGYSLRRVQIFASCLALLTLSMYVAFKPHSRSMRLDPGVTTLRFEACNGFANQRLSILYGILLAHKLNRAAVLPSLIYNGSQQSDQWLTSTAGNSAPFSAMYDPNLFIDLATAAGWNVFSPQQAPPLDEYQNVSLDTPQDPVALLNSAQHRHRPHLAVDCPLLRLRAKDLLGHEKQLEQLLQALQPSTEYSLHIAEAVSKLRAQSQEEAYNFLHLRLEQDWQAHCARWEAIPDGLVRNNCFNNTLTVDQQLLERGFLTSTPLYVASSWSQADPGEAQAVQSRLASAGYRILTRADLLPSLLLPRETGALIDYYLAQSAQRFIGNSVSTFSALLILERQQRGLWAGYYNGGNIPLAEFFPLFRMPWLFTWPASATPDDKTLLKAAVRSAIRAGQVVPYCLCGSDAPMRVYDWLRREGVRPVRHDPPWWTSPERGRDLLALSGAGNSSRFGTEGSAGDAPAPQVLRGPSGGGNPTDGLGRPRQLGNAWRLVDAPLVQELQQYDFVLHSGVDVYFRGRTSLTTFPLPLPEAVGLSSLQGGARAGGGLMLLNLPGLRASRAAFLRFLRAKDQLGGLLEDGPAAVQSAHAQFYKSSAGGYRMPDVLEATPHSRFLRDALIVRFGGPRPWDYLEWFRSGACSHDGLCELGVRQALCPYLAEWYQHADATDETAKQLHRLCLIKQDADVGALNDSVIARSRKLRNLQWQP